MYDHAICEIFESWKFSVHEYILNALRSLGLNNLFIELSFTQHFSSLFFIAQPLALLRTIFWDIQFE